ncbi:MAG: hypothetical protein H7A25_00595 [Leptospiraceae bacterium]|nr:hypothetical protein [Leptospiraceae bacterium]MCP5498375.1 hypothetical protein [Leptospiraceae bacterium]
MALNVVIGLIVLGLFFFGVWMYFKESRGEGGPASGSYFISFPEEVLEQLEKDAERDDRTVPHQVVHILREHYLKKGL